MYVKRIVRRALTLGCISLLSLLSATGEAWADPVSVPEPLESSASQESSDPVDTGVSVLIDVPHPRLFYYYNSNLAGAYRVFSTDVSNLAGYKYDAVGTTSAGLGQYVKNNAASIRHYSYSSTGMPVVVFFYSGYGFPADACVPNCAGNLTPDLKNNNASHRWQW